MKPHKQEKFQTFKLDKIKKKLEQLGIVPDWVGITTDSPPFNLFLYLYETSVWNQKAI